MAKDGAKRKRQDSNPPERSKAQQIYDAQLKRTTARWRNISAQGREIAPIPKVRYRTRRAQALKSFRYFCERYFPNSFPEPWSDDHLKAITKIERAVTEGGQFAFAMHRGGGKSTLCEKAVLWAILTGKHQFVVLIGSDSTHATDSLDAIKVEFENNDMLAGDFPEVCYPIRKLERIYQRSKGQIYKGQPTAMDWTADSITLPTIPGSRASGAVIKTAGLEARIRGMKFAKQDGTQIRPSLVILDDPQTDESARSPAQVAKRLALINGAVLNLAGPGKSISALMPTTVIEPNDVADQILNPDLFPTWQGERFKFVYEWPERMDLWETYTEIRKDSFKSGGKGEPATKFYKQNRKEMDRGARVAWESYYLDGELSALQCAMNKRFRDTASERAFMAEFQNEPMPPLEEMLIGQKWYVKVDDHLSGTPRGIVPEDANLVTAFIDVQANCLFWLVAAWENDFTGHVIDYGCYPDQNSGYYTVNSLKKTLKLLYPGMGEEARIYAGLRGLTEKLLAREWLREDGAALRIQRCVIDSNFSTSVIYKFCRQSGYAASLIPSHGHFFGASSIPMSDYRRKPKDRLGLNWRVPGKVGEGAVRYVLFDANFWKTFIMQRLFVSIGDPGSMSFYGRDASAHNMLRDHLLAEFPVETQGRGRVVNEWKPRANKSDNHFLDCIVGAAVAASMEGITLPEHHQKAPPKAKRLVTLSEKVRRQMPQRTPAPLR